MGLEDLRRWHWAGLGIAAGLAFAAVHNFYGSEVAIEEASSRLNVRRDFENGLVASATVASRIAKITDVTIYPEREGKIWMTFMRYHPSRTLIDPNDPSKGVEAKGVFTSFDVTEPYKPEAVMPADPTVLPTLTIRQYLASLQQQFPDAQIRYRYAWWYEPTNMYLLGAGIGLVAVGGVWPSIIGLLTGGGLWGQRRRDKREDEEYLARFGKGGAEPATVAAATMPTDGDAQLADLEDAMLANLSGFGSGGGNRDTGSVDEDAEEVIRPLTGGPAETPAEVAARDEQKAREFAGDFYPVARPGGAKKDE